MTPEARWDIYLADLEPVSGSEQGGRRPVLVVSNNDFNNVMPVVTVLPITSLKPGRRIHPTEILIKKGISMLDVDSLVLTYQIRTITKKRIFKLIGKIEEREKQQEVETALKLHLGLE